MYERKRKSAKLEAITLVILSFFMSCVYGPWQIWMWKKEQIEHGVGSVPIRWGWFFWRKVVPYELPDAIRWKS